MLEIVSTYGEGTDGIMYLLEEDISPERRKLLGARAEHLNSVAIEANRRHELGEPGMGGFGSLSLSQLSKMFGMTEPERDGVVVRLPHAPKPQAKASKKPKTPPA